MKLYINVDISSSFVFLQCFSYHFTRAQNRDVGGTSDWQLVGQADMGLLHEG